MGQERPGDSNSENKSGHAPSVAPSPHHQSALIVIRILARLGILSIFANLGTHGFGKTLITLLVMAALYCVIAASIRREAPFGPILTHFDEAAAYTLCAMATSLAA